MRRFHSSFGFSVRGTRLSPCRRTALQGWMVAQKSDSRTTNEIFRRPSPSVRSARGPADQSVIDLTLYIAFKLLLLYCINQSLSRYKSMQADRDELEVDMHLWACVGADPRPKGQIARKTETEKRITCRYFLVSKGSNCSCQSSKGET
jgi:hypothetical protein